MDYWQLLILIVVTDETDFYVGIGVNCFSLLIFILLIAGTENRNRYMLLPWLILTMLFLVAILVIIVLMAISYIGIEIELFAYLPKINVPLILLWEGYHDVNGLFVTNIEVPELVDYQERVKLSCSYNMGGHKLNSVKWYKDGLEFFRYAPMAQPIFMNFPVNGVSLTNNAHYCNEVTCSIDLADLNYESSGAYRCEVSGDAPEFKLTSRTANMTVAALPKYDPIIYGVNITYRLNDFVVANCSSDYSNPPATLTWFINDEKAPPETLQPLQEMTITKNNFKVLRRNLEVRFTLDRQRVITSKGVLKMKCVADINQIASYRREKQTTSYILTKDDLTNQKLVNWKNSANHRCAALSTLIVNSGIFLMTMRLLQRNLLKDTSR